MSGVPPGVGLVRLVHTGQQMRSGGAGLFLGLRTHRHWCWTWDTASFTRPGPELTFGLDQSAAGQNPRRCPPGDRHPLPPGGWPLTCAVSLKVRDSLPAAMLRHVDAGGVQMEVTRVANGSVVVEFNLLIIADVDVREVSAAFLVALRNASLLEVVGEDTFIQGRWRPGPPRPGHSPCSGSEAGRAQHVGLFGVPLQEMPVWNTQAPCLSYGYCAISGG